VPGQTVPQAPQLVRSFWGFTQRPHQIWPLGQHSFRLATHSPARLGHSRRPPGQPQLVPLQTKSPWHSLPQLPQWSGLLRTLVQVPPHTRLGLAQVQTWFTQASMPAQARPQVPQLRALLFKFTQD